MSFNFYVKGIFCESAINKEPYNTTDHGRRHAHTNIMHGQKHHRTVQALHHKTI